MGDVSSKSINFREAAILAIAIVLATAIGPLGLMFVFERDRKEPEHDVLWLITAVYLTIIVILILIITNMRK
uniref:Transmembrane protein n=1 Tax=Pithovirus LCPAC401 TaxID=2506595 RepID=A0A481ZB56_9VIRU|nr:MAG: hypothetical protein LCPAC401_00180 [Pithovirus LCPAC401]